MSNGSFKFIVMLAGILATSFALVSIASAQTSNPWYFNGTNIRPNVSTWGLMVPALANKSCLGTDANGVFGSGTCSGGGGAWPFTTGLTNYATSTQATTTPEWFQNGLMASTTSYFVNASSSLTSFLTSTWFPSITNGLLSTDQNGLVTASTSIGYNYIKGGPPNTATTTFSAPLVYTVGTNAVTCTNASNGVTGCMSANDWSLLHAATSTFSAPLVYTVGTNAVTCTNASGGVTGCLTGTDWTTFNNKQATLTFSAPLILNGTTVSWYGISTSTALTGGQLLYASDANHATSIATSSETCTSPLSCTSYLVVGSGGGAITIQNASASQTGALTSTDWTTFNGKLNFSNLWNISTTFGTTTRATTTPEWFQTAFFASSTAASPSVIDNFTFTNATGTAATTTSMAITSVKSALYLANANGSVIPYAGASACSANNFVTAYSAVGATTCGTAAISGVNLGSNLNSLSNDAATLSGTSYNGSATVSNWAINLANANTWTGLQKFAGAGTTTVANGLEVGGKIGTPYVMATSSLATSTFSGGVQINGGLNLATGVSGFLKAVSGVVTTALINLSSDITGTLGAGNGGTGGTSLSPAFTVASNVFSEVTEKSFTYSTTTWTGTTSRALFQGTIASTISGVRCKTYTTGMVPGGTLNIQIGKWTASTTMLSASSTNNYNAFTSNNTVAAGDSWYIEIGTPASTPIQINCTYKFQV